jgi:Na+/H+ antiporter NhaD/arsenite permease-like protein
LEAIIAAIIFLVTIFFVVTGIIDRAVAAITGAILMVLFGVMDEATAFFSVDWNIIALLIGIWIIATYFNKTGIPSVLAAKVVELSRNKMALFMSLIGLLAGFLSTFLDNVIVVLMMAPIIVPYVKAMRLKATPFILFAALSANFMGTALLLGDLPPQMLHSVTGIEFTEFIWQFNRPSSFPILTTTFILTVLFFYMFRFKREYLHVKIDRLKKEGRDPAIKDRKFAYIVVVMFILTITAMALRQFIGVKLGFIAITGAAMLMVILEALGRRITKPSFGEILMDLDWKAVFFYISLFILVGGIEEAGIIKLIADSLSPILVKPVLGPTILYWTTVPIVGIVEHDAYILTFLHIIKDVATGINPWPYYWILLWAGTLGSNLTMVGAPALYVALNICEKEDGKKVEIGEFFSYTIPFVVLSAIINYILAMAIWVLYPI